MLKRLNTLESTNSVIHVHFFARYTNQLLVNCDQPRRNQKVLTRHIDTTANSKAHGDVATAENPTRQPACAIHSRFCFAFQIPTSKATD